MNTKETIAHFKLILPCERMILTGSTVLAMHGLTEAPNDLDIILVNASEQAQSVLKSLEEAAGYKRNPNYPMDMAIIKFEDKKIDFFLQKECKEKTLFDNGLNIEVSTVMSIVEAKKSYKRMKDMVQLRRMAMKICNIADVTHALDNYKV